MNEEMEKKLQNSCPTGYNLLIVQDLSQGHYQVLLIILLTEFIKLSINTNTMIKNVKLAELNTNIATAFANTQTSKID